MAPGEELEAQIHLYEAMPGMRLSDMVRGEQVIANVDGEDGYSLHPLTREAAALLLGQPEMGRDIGPARPGTRMRRRWVSASIIWRFRANVRSWFRLPVGPRCVDVPGADCLHFPKNEILACLYLSEIRAQEIAVKLRQKAHMGVTERLRRIVTRGWTGLCANVGRLKIVHGAVIPGQP